MAAPYVTAAEILTAAGIASPTAADTDWATKCAAAIEARIVELLDGDTPSSGMESRLHVAAELDGAMLFNSRTAPNGIATTGVDGDVVRVSSSQTRALDNVFLPGIG